MVAILEMDNLGVGLESGRWDRKTPLQLENGEEECLPFGFDNSALSDGIRRRVMFSARPQQVCCRDNLE